MDPKYVKLRMALLGLSVLGILLWTLSDWMARFRDPAASIAAMLAVSAYALLRGTCGQDRRLSMSYLRRYDGTDMAYSPCAWPYVRAARAWLLCDAVAVAADVPTCLTWGLPGVLAVVFQAVFFAGFPMAAAYKPDLYTADEKAQSLDMAEAMMYAMACAAICVAAIFSLRR